MRRATDPREGTSSPRIRQQRAISRSRRPLAWALGEEDDAANKAIEQALGDH
jgi:hypothetical protein